MKKIIIIEDDWNQRPLDTFVQRYEDPCANCPNNPMINPYASGICNCALPALTNPIF